MKRCAVNGRSGATLTVPWRGTHNPCLRRRPAARRCCRVWVWKHTRQTWHFQEQQKPAWKVQLPYTFSFNLTHTLLYRATNWENIRWYMVIIMWKCVSTPARTFNEQRRHVARQTKKGKSLASRHSQLSTAECQLHNCTLPYVALRYSCALQPETVQHPQNTARVTSWRGSEVRVKETQWKWSSREWHQSLTS